MPVAGAMSCLIIVSLPRSAMGFTYLEVVRQLQLAALGSLLCQRLDLRV
jgi:hypothetical protein